MKVLIRHPMTKLYRRKDGVWIKDWKKAQHFEDTFESLKFCNAAELDAYQVLLKHPSNEGYDVIVLERLADEADGKAATNGNGNGHASIEKIDGQRVKKRKRASA